MEGLEINTLWELHSTNARRELGENPDPTPPFDKSWACVLNRFPEFFSSTQIHLLTAVSCLQPLLAPPLPVSFPFVPTSVHESLPK